MGHSTASQRSEISEEMSDFGEEMKELIRKGVEEAMEKAMDAMRQSLAEWFKESQTTTKKKMGKNYASPSKLATENDEGGREIEVGGEGTQAKEVSKLQPEMPAFQVFDEKSERVFVQKAPLLISKGTNPLICSPNSYCNALKTHCNMVLVYKLHENEYGKFDSKIENRTPETHLVGRSLSPGIAPVSSRNSLVEDQTGRNSLNHSSSMTELAGVAASLSGLSLSKHVVDPLQTQLAHRFDKQSGKQSNLSNGYGQSFPQAKEVSRAEKLALATNYVDLLKENGLVKDLNAVKLGLNDQANFPRRTSSSANLQSKWNSSGIANFENPNMRYLAENYPHPDFHGHLQSGYVTDQELKAVVNNQLNAAATLSNTGMRRKLRSGNQAGFDLHSPVMDPRYIQYLQQSSDHAVHAASLSDPSRLGNASGLFSRGDLQILQKAYLATPVAQQKQQYDMGKAALLNHQYYANPSFGPMPYQGNLIQNTVLSFGPKGPMLQDDIISRYASMMQNQMGGSSGSWHPETGINVERSFAASLLEEIKNNKSRSFELLDVVDHVVEFSKDQYSSQFIQQKLETATEEEKMKIFSEIFPHARSLITDVFGNYVIQKFFEHGTESERNELANQLIGHVLPLSLQIYGCRVIQKALEVVDVDQQTKLLPLLSYIGGSGVPEMAVLGSARFIVNIKEPVVCGIASLGVDHMEILGDTLREIASHKAGILKPHIHAFSSPQAAEAMEVLQDRASELGVPLELAAPLDYKRLNGLKLSLSGDHQLINAGLAISLCKCWLQVTGNWKNPSENDSEKHNLPEAFKRGLSTARLSRRAPIVNDAPFKTCKSEGNEISSGNLIFYLDGAHGPESIDACARWFSNAVKAEKMLASSSSEVNNLENVSGKSCIQNNEWKDNETTRQILLFNCMNSRDPHVLLSRLVNICASSGSHFSKAIFVPNLSTYSRVTSGASVIPMDILARDLSWQLHLQRMWEKIVYGKDVMLDGKSKMASAENLPSHEFLIKSASCHSPEDGYFRRSAVIPSLPLSIKWLRDCARENPSLKIQVLVTGSLHLVGDVLRLLRR